MQRTGIELMEGKEPLHYYVERQLHPNTARIGFFAFIMGMIGLLLVLLYSDICLAILIAILVGMVGYSIRNPVVGLFEIYDSVLVYDNTKKKISIPVESIKKILEVKTRKFIIAKITHDDGTVQVNYVDKKEYKEMRDALKQILGDRWEKIAIQVE